MSFPGVGTNALAPTKSPCSFSLGPNLPSYGQVLAAQTCGFAPPTAAIPPAGPRVPGPCYPIAGVSQGIPSLCGGCQGR